MAIPAAPALATDPDTIGGIITTLKNTHDSLKVLATSKLSCLPRCTFINIGEWIVTIDPQSRFDVAAEVVTVGQGEALKGRISPLAAAIHPFESFKKSTFTTIHVEKIDHAPQTQVISAFHSALGWLSLALELSSLLTWISGDLYPIIHGFKSTTDIIHLMVCVAFGPINFLLLFGSCEFCLRYFEGWLASRFENVDHPSSAETKTYNNSHPKLTWPMRTMVQLSFFIWVAALLYSMVVKEIEATLFLSVLGAYNSIITYLTRWRQIRIQTESSRLESLRNKTKGDVMICSEEGALILVKCSPQVAEELYFNFPSYEAQLILPNDPSTGALLQLGLLGLGGASLFFYEFVRIFWTSVRCSRIVLYSCFATCGLEVLFAAIPVYYRWDVSRYYWADITPPKSEAEKPTNDCESVDPTIDPYAKSSLLAEMDRGLIRAVKTAIDASLDTRWLTALDVAKKSGKLKEVQVATMIAGCALSKTLPMMDFVFKKGLKSKLLGQADILNDTLAAHLLSFSFALERLRRVKKEEHKVPDPSTFHINSVPRQLGYGFYPVNILKMFVDFCVGRPMSWYPFNDPEDWPPSRLVRIYSLDPENSRRVRFYFDMPANLADRLFAFPFTKAMANSSDGSMFEMPSVFLHGTSIVKILLDLYGSRKPKLATTEAETSNPPEAVPSQDAEEQQPESSNTPQPDFQQGNTSSGHEEEMLMAKPRASDTMEVSSPQNTEEEQPSFDELDTKLRERDIVFDPVNGVSKAEIKVPTISEASIAQTTEQQQPAVPDMSDPNFRERDAAPNHENGTSETEASTSNVVEASPPQATDHQQSSSSSDADLQQQNIAPNRSDETPETEAQGVSVPPIEPDDRDRDTLFICADIATHESRARAVKLGKNDRGTIDQLRSTYRSLHPRLPRIKRITGIKFFRFHSFLQREMDEHKQLLVHIHKDMQRYPLESDPEYHEYRYFPRPWPAQLPFPDREICWYFLHPEDCGTSSSLNQMLPARVGDDLVTHRRAFGIYIEELYSLWAIFIPVLLLSSMLLGATLWFIKGHTDDLQTAIVPFTVASSIGTLVINVSVSLLLFRMLAP